MPSSHRPHQRSLSTSVCRVDITSHQEALQRQLVSLQRHLVQIRNTILLRGEPEEQKIIIELLSEVGWMGGGSRCRMSIIRNGNVALSNLRNIPVALSNLRNSPVALSNLRNSPAALSNLRNSPAALSKFKKLPCRMSLRPKKGLVALSILGVHTHIRCGHQIAAEGGDNR